MPEDQLFTLEGFRTQGGTTLDLQLAYRVHGELNANKDNLVVLPTFYSERPRWVGMMRAAIHTAEQRFSATRMVNRYWSDLYYPED